MLYGLVWKGNIFELRKPCNTEVFPIYDVILNLYDDDDDDDDDDDSEHSNNMKSVLQSWHSNIMYAMDLYQPFWMLGVVWGVDERRRS